MRIKNLVTGLLVVGLMACDDTLSLSPTSEVREEDAIVDAGSARAALAGAYDKLQDGNYYGGEFLFYSDLLSLDVEHTGTFSDYAATDANRVVPDNESLLGIWTSIYGVVGVANQLIARVPDVPGMTQAERDDIIGQAHFLRALAFHDLTKLWGDIQMPLTPPASIEESANMAKTPRAAVYTQILADLAQAEALITNTGTRKVTADAAIALRSRVLLFQASAAPSAAAWTAVIDEANKLEAGYSLATNYSDLFTADGQDTPEDIFRVSFTAVEFNNIGFFYFSRSFGGRWEVAPTFDLIQAYGESSDPTFDIDTVQTQGFNPADPRAAWNIAFDARDRNYGGKIPTPIGAEDIHVIRFAEVILNKAEALANRGSAADLIAATQELNRIRARAGVTPLSLVALTQAGVLANVYRERRMELAMEGFAWPDLVRTGRAIAVMGADVEPFELLLPIPQAEIDVITVANFQNPGY